MSELDLLSLARSATANEVSWFGEIVTINFAMIVGIYYFLNQARLPLRVFAFIAYMIGMLVFLGEMLIESGLKYMVLVQMRALPHPSPILQEYIGVTDSWLGRTTSFVFNSAFWILWIGVFYLLFFFNKSAHETRSPT
jgi:hypothetical protein